MKHLLIAFLLWNSLLHAQTKADGMISTERNFAAYSVLHGTKEAFLLYLDSNGVVFDKGNPVNGLSFWQAQDTRPGILNWWPQYAEISLSGDFGYTSGPWTYQPATAKDSVVSRGQFITVWHKDGKGQWKFLVDLGIRHAVENPEMEVKLIKGAKYISNYDPPSLLQAEKDFTEAYASSPARAYKMYLSRRSILNRNGRLPAIKVDDQARVIALANPQVRFETLGYGSATSGDLGYVYGTTDLGGKKENYLHIWRREKGGWKLALEVLRY